MAVQTGQPQGQSPIDNGFSTNPGAKQNDTLNNAGGSTDGGGLFDFGQGLHALPVTSTQGGQSIRDIMKVWEEMEKRDVVWDMTLVALDNTQETGWFASSAVALVWNKAEAAANGGVPNKVAVYPMLLAGTEKRPLSSFTVKLRDLEYPVQEVASMAMNDQYKERITQLVTEHFGGKAINILHVPGMVVHKEVDLTKPDQVRPLIENAARAGVTAIAQSIPKFTDVDLSRLAAGSTQVMKIEMVTQPLFDITGQPIRRDFDMTFSDRAGKAQQQTVSERRSLNDVGAIETNWARMSLFLDLSYMPPSAPQVYASHMDQSAQHRVFVPRAIVTDIHHYQLATVASTMLMLAQTVALAQPNIWFGLFWQRMKNHNLHFGGDSKSKVEDPTDLGTLNLVARAIGDGKGNFGPVDLKSNDIRPEDFISFAQKVLVPQIHVAIDVPHAGPRSFFMGIISAAANGDPVALRALVGHMDKLTGGLFSQRYLKGDSTNVSVGQFFSEVNNTTPGGYAFVKGPDGAPQKVDLRTVDYLYVLNKFKNDPTTVKKWSQSFLVGELEVAKRLGQRMDVLSACFTNVNVNSYYERHTFRSDMLMALFNCMLELKVRPELKYMDPLRDAAGDENAPAFVRQQGLQANGLTAGFQQPGGGMTGGLGTGGLAGGGLGRWG